MKNLNNVPLPDAQARITSFVATRDETWIWLDLYGEEEAARRWCKANESKPLPKTNEKR